MKAIIDHLLHDFEEGRLSRRQLVHHLGAMAAVAVPGGAVARSAGGAVEGGGDGSKQEPGSASTGEAAAPTAAQENAPTFQAVGLNHIALSVTDIPRSRDFYVRHLGLTVSRESESSCFLDCGSQFVALFRTAQAGLNHYCYAVEGYDVEAAEETLRAAGLPPRVSGNRIYFDDPDGLEVQLSAPELQV